MLDLILDKRTEWSREVLTAQEVASQHDRFATVRFEELLSEQIVQQCFESKNPLQINYDRQDSNFCNRRKYLPGLIESSVTGSGYRSWPVKLTSSIHPVQC